MDIEPFIGWLRGQGESEEYLAAYRVYIAELAKHPSLSAALRAAEDAGLPAKQIANLRRTAARLAEFEEAGRTVPTVVAPTAPQLVDLHNVEPRRTRPPSAMLQAPVPPRRGCTCKRHYDVYLDNDFGALAKMLGGGVGVGTFLLIRFVGLFGALALALGLAGIGGLATTLSICFRCEGCRRRVTDLDADEHDHLRKGRAVVIAVTIGLIVGAAVCGFAWWQFRRPPLR